MINCFCYYVIKSAGETTNESYVISHLKYIAYRKNISQIRISDSKREEVCAVRPYLLFTVNLGASTGIINM